jgi:hypothetical protein
MRAHFRPRRGARACASATILGVGIFASFAESRAQPRGAARAVALAWTAPEECPDIEYVEHEIGRLLAGATMPIAPELRARAEVRRVGASDWRVVLETESAEGGGRRTLTAESCRAAADATALILALAVDPARVATNQRAPAASASVTPAASASAASDVAPSAASLPPTAPPRREAGTSTPAVRPRAQVDEGVRSSSLFFSLAFADDLGTMPTYAPGGFATGGFAPEVAPWLRFEAAAGVFKNETTYVIAKANGVFSLRAFDAGLCIRLYPFLGIRSRYEVGACADAELSWMVAGGESQPSTFTRGATWLVWRPRATFAYWLSPHWAIRGDVGAGIANGAPPQFVDIASGSASLVHQPAAVTGRISIGLEARF